MMQFHKRKSLRKDAERVAKSAQVKLDAAFYKIEQEQKRTVMLNRFERIKVWNELREIRRVFVPSYIPRENENSVQERNVDDREVGSHGTRRKLSVLTSKQENYAVMSTKRDKNPVKHGSKENNDDVFTDKLNASKNILTVKDRRLSYDAGRQRNTENTLNYNFKALEDISDCSTSKDATRNAHVPLSHRAMASSPSKTMLNVSSGYLSFKRFVKDKAHTKSLISPRFRCKSETEVDMEEKSAFLLKQQPSCKSPLNASKTRNDNSRYCILKDDYVQESTRSFSIDGNSTSKGDNKVERTSVCIQKLKKKLSLGEREENTGATGPGVKNVKTKVRYRSLSTSEDVMATCQIKYGLGKQDCGKISSLEVNHGKTSVARREGREENSQENKIQGEKTRLIKRSLNTMRGRSKSLSMVPLANDEKIYGVRNHSTTALDDLANKKQQKYQNNSVWVHPINCDENKRHHSASLARIDLNDNKYRKEFSQQKHGSKQNHTLEAQRKTKLDYIRIKRNSIVEYPLQKINETKEAW